MSPRSLPSIRASLAVALAVALAVTGCSDSPTEPGDDEVVDPVATLTGRVEVVGGSVPEGLEVVAQWGILEADAAVESDGSFELRLTAEPAVPGFLGVRPPDEGGLVPALIRLEDPLLPESIRVVVLPDRWTIQRGAYAGTEVDVRPSEAASGGVLPSFWGLAFPFEQDGRLQTVLDSTYWTGGLTTWPEDAFPVAVVLDREASSSELESADSVQLWTALDRLEGVLGRDLFRPARLEELPAPDPDLGDRPPGAVLVRVDSTLSLRGRAAAVTAGSTWFRTQDVGSWSGSQVSRLGVVSADARAGWMAVSAREHLGNGRIVMHEAMHVLGVGHGCTWPSIQTYCESLITEEPTPDDVAHLEVLEAARASEKELDTQYGILQAVFGDRALRQGLSPIPGVDLTPPGEG